MNPVFDRNFIIRMAQYTKREFNEALLQAEDAAYEKAKINVENRYDQDYYKKRMEVAEAKAKDAEEKFTALQKILNVEYIFEHYKDTKELENAGRLLSAILDINGLLDRGNWYLRDIENHLKRVEESTANVKQAIKEWHREAIEPSQKQEASP